MKILRLTVTSLIFAIILFSLFTTVFTKTSEGAIPVRLKHRLILDWDADEDPIVPRDELKIVNVTITYTLEFGLNFSEGMYLNYIHYGEIFGGNQFGKTLKGKIVLEILEIPEWCHATFRYPLAVVNISSKYITQMPLYLLLDEDAPAFSKGYIKIKATLKPFPTVPYISKEETTINLSFQPSYLPRISVDLPDINTAQIEPQEKASFPIKITNIGNDKTYVSIEVENLPKGWAATVTDGVLLDEEESNIATLTVNPPKDFGYREDVGIVRISLTPSRAVNSSEIGDKMSLSFLVQSKGFFVGGQGIIIFLALIVILIIAFLAIRSIARKKFKDL